MCHRRLPILMLILTASTVLAVFTKSPSCWYFVRDDGGRTSATVNSLITDIGTNRLVRFIFDGGTWSFTNNVTFPTNISVQIVEDSNWVVATNTTATLSTASFIANDYLCFTGDGVVTGAPSFLHRYTNWGDTNQFNIGTGILD